MKKISLVIAFLFGAFVMIYAQTKKINVEKSTVNWKAYKVLGGHEGTVKIKEGGLTFKGSKLIAGSVSVDLNTISATDEEGEMKAKLDSHLKGDDFFDVAKFPKVSFVFKSVKAKSKGIYTITADATIKGVTKPVTFDLKVNKNKATSSLKIDRSLFGLTYGSDLSLGNKMIKNEFDLNVVLVY